MLSLKNFMYRKEFDSGQEIAREKNSLRESFFESGKIVILNKSNRKLQLFDTADLIPLKAGGNSWGNCNSHDIIVFLNEE